MTHRIQKTIIGKYIEFIEQDLTSENQIEELLSTTEGLYSTRILSNSDIYRHKIDLIKTKLLNDLETVKRKRTNKAIKIEVSKDFYNLLKSDLEGIDYTKTKLSDLDRFENSNDIEINKESIKEILENLVIIKRRLSSEADLEKFIFDQLSIVLGKDRVHRQYSVGGFLSLKTDIDVGNGLVGIELKIAENLTASEMQRLIGQAVYYKKRFYDQNLLVVIAGKTNISSSIKELIDFIEEFGIEVIYLTAINW